MKRKITTLFSVLVLMLGMLTGCGSTSRTPDDFASNEGYKTDEKEDICDVEKTGISKDDIKVGVLYISDPAEGSGYSYTHDLGILGMQSK